MLLATAYPVPVPTPSHTEPPLSPRKFAILADLFDVVVLWVDATVINPKRGIYSAPKGSPYYWHPTAGDQILMDHIAAFRHAGLTRQIYKWSNIPAHGTLEGKITFCERTFGACPWLLDENGDALIPGQSVYNKDLDYVRKPATPHQQWVRWYRQHAMARYGVNFEGWCDFNEPDDGASNPAMDGEGWTQDRGLRLIFDNVHLPAAKVHAEAMWPVANLGPEAAYDDGLRRLLVMERESGQRIWTIRTFHGYPLPEKNNADGALDQLAIRRQIIIDERGKADGEWMTEIHDSGAKGTTAEGWFMDYLPKVQSVYPELACVTWLYSDETLFTPESLTAEAIEWDATHPGPRYSYVLSEWGKALKAVRDQQKRRAVQP